jgi:hypothetical protein
MRLYARGFAFLAFSLLAVPLAAADDVPTAIVERPLSLAPHTMQPSIGIALARAGGQNTELVEFGADYGLIEKLQVGAVVDIRLSPSSDFTRGLVNGQYQFVAFAALRLDLGAQRFGNGDLGFAFGAGLPLRLKLAESVALISSRPNAYAADDDILYVQTGSGTVTRYKFPIGVLYQIDKHVSFAGRAGYAVVDDASFIPLGVDFTVSVSRLDFGATFDLPGQIAPDGAPGFFDALQLRAFAQIRM